MRAVVIWEYIILTARVLGSYEVKKNGTRSRRGMVTACPGIEKELDVYPKTIHANTLAREDMIPYALLLESIVKRGGGLFQMNSDFYLTL